MQHSPALKWILKLKTAVGVDKASRREKRKPNEQQKSTSSGRCFASVQMFPTHTCPCLILRSLSLEWRTGLHHRLCCLLLLSLVTKAEPKSKLVLIQSWHPMYSSRMHQAFNNPCLRPKLCHSRGNAINAS